jgi:NAD(P)H-hydrate epimerase
LQFTNFIGFIAVAFSYSLWVRKITIFVSSLAIHPMKVFTCKQIQSIDAYTIENEPIHSIDLMERAALELFKWIVKKFRSINPVYIFSGPGNNGGDGVAIGRMLHQIGYDVKVFVLSAKKYSPDLTVNIQRLINMGLYPVTISSKEDFPDFFHGALIIDSLFGSGLSKPLSGIAADLVDHINNSGCQVVSIDIPSGLFGEENPYPSKNPVINASVTLTLQFPKLSFFFAENDQHVGDWSIIDIGLHPQAIHQTESPFTYVDRDLIKGIIKPRHKFQHKGNFGHCLIIAGSYGMLGAAVLSTRACLRAGAGLVNVHVPRQGVPVLQTSVPEAIVQVDDNEWIITGIDNPDTFSTIGIGPGIGKNTRTQMGIFNLLSISKCPLVIDADGLNIISLLPDMLDHLPLNSILTPHVGEFDRLFGKSDCAFSRLSLAIKKANELNVVIVIKGAYSQVVCPNGKVFFNSTGNPGMSTAGSGDVLTGIITSLVGQGYSSVDAALAGAFLHGLAGDIAADAKGQQSVLASDIIDYLDEAFLLIDK